MDSIFGGRANVDVPAKASAGLENFILEDSQAGFVDLTDSGNLGFREVLEPEEDRDGGLVSPEGTFDHAANCDGEGLDPEDGDFTAPEEPIQPDETVTQVRVDFSEPQPQTPKQRKRHSMEHVRSSERKKHSTRSPARNVAKVYENSQKEKIEIRRGGLQFKYDYLAEKQKFREEEFAYRVTKQRGDMIRSLAAAGKTPEEIQAYLALL